MLLKNMNKNNICYFLWFSRYMKFSGYCALIIGIVMTLMNILSFYILNMPFTVNGVESKDMVIKSLMVIVPFVVAIIGFLLIRAKPITRKNNPEFFASFETPEKAKQPWER